MPSSLVVPTVIAVVFSTLVLTGCSSPAPAVTPEGTETSATASPETMPTPEPVAEPALITIAATGLTVTDAASDVLLQVGYSDDSDTVVAQLSEVLGESPTAMVEGGGACSVEQTITSWGGLRLRDPAGFAAGPGAAFTVGAEALTTAGGVSIVASAGFAVGDPLASALALSGVSSVDYGDFVTVYSDLQGPSFDDPSAWGVYGSTTSGVIERYSAPVYFNYDC